MQSTLELKLELAIKTYHDPYIQTDLVTSKAVRLITVDDKGNAKVSIVLGFPAPSYHKVLRKELSERILSIPSINTVEIDISTKIIAHAVQDGVQNTQPKIKNIIAVASGKGGVGKSTVAVNLALALLGEGAQVGILDADIYGPSQPRMLGVSESAHVYENKQFEPVRAHGLQSMSIGYLIDNNTPMVWRGPMVSTALQQLLRDTRWEEMDYLIIDLPPGTGDIQLTLAQKIPVSGAVIITTPQDIALLDARKGLEMFKKVKISILGIIENMSTHTCSQCGHEESVFGFGGGQRLAQECAVDLLGSLPLDRNIREQVDIGIPSVVADPNGKVALQYREIARKLSAKLALCPRNYSHTFPKIITE